MKTFTTVVTFLLFSFLSLGQSSTSKQQQAQTIEYAQLHLVEYEIVGVSNPSTELLNQIPFEIYNQQRLEMEDIQIQDVNSGYTIVLYSNQKCATNKQ